MAYPGDARLSAHLTVTHNAGQEYEFTKSCGAQNPAPPLPLEPPPELPAVVGVVVFCCPLFEAPPLEPQAEAPMPRMEIIAIGTSHRAILRRTVEDRLVMCSLASSRTAFACQKEYGRGGARDCAFRRAEGSVSAIRIRRRPWCPETSRFVATNSMDPEWIPVPVSSAKEPSIGAEQPRGGVPRLRARWTVGE